MSSYPSRAFAPNRLAYVVGKLNWRENAAFRKVQNDMQLAGTWQYEPETSRSVLIDFTALWQRLRAVLYLRVLYLAARNAARFASDGASA